MSRHWLETIFEDVKNASKLDLKMNIAVKHICILRNNGIVFYEEFDNFLQKQEAFDNAATLLRTLAPTLKIVGFK